MMVSDKKSNDWRFLYVLPNLYIQESCSFEPGRIEYVSFESDWLAICSGDDPRVSGLTQGEYGRVLARFIDSFEDYNGNKYRPAVMLERESNPLKPEAHRAFRNIAAIATVVQTFAQEIIDWHQAQLKIKWTDAFDFYPLLIHRDGSIGTLPSLGVIRGELGQKFRGQCSPREFRPDQMRCDFDSKLFDLLKECWISYYIKNQHNSFAEKLFRSLDIAYHAGRFPTDGLGTIYDVGIRIMLWISAFEVLFRPEGKEVHICGILKSLNEIRFWKDKKLFYKRFKFRSRKCPMSCNLVAKMYSDIYKVRNDFLHGNSVTIYTQYVKGKRMSKPWILVAPVLYALVLNGKLMVELNKKEEDFSLVQNFFGLQEKYEEALFVSFYGNKKGSDK